MKLEHLNHKLVRFNNEYYVVSNEELLVHHWALLPNHFKVYMDDANYIDYLDSESYATKKIIASTDKLNGCYLIDKNTIEAHINKTSTDIILDESKKWTDKDIINCYIDAVNNAGDYLLNMHLDRPKPLSAEQYLESISLSKKHSAKNGWDIELDFEFKPLTYSRP